MTLANGRWDWGPLNHRPGLDGRVGKAATPSKRHRKRRGGYRAYTHLIRWIPSMPSPSASAGVTSKRRPGTTGRLATTWVRIRGL